MVMVSRRLGGRAPLVDGWRRPAPDESLLQVLMQSASRCNEPNACVYLLRSAALRLLHIPPHVFAVLAAHRHREVHRGLHAELQLEHDAGRRIDV